MSRFFGARPPPPELRGRLRASRTGRLGLVQYNRFDPIAWGDVIERAIGFAVEQLWAEQGYSWTAIGEPTGITRKSAQERWGTRS